MEQSRDYGAHNREVGAEIFRWMYSKAPHDVWDGFFLQGMKTPEVIHRATRKAGVAVRLERRSAEAGKENQP